MCMYIFITSRAPLSMFFKKYKHHENTLLKYVSEHCPFLSLNILQKRCPYINSTCINLNY